MNFLLDWDKKGQYRLAALQSKAGSDLLQQAGRKPGDLSSVVLVEPGHAYVKSEAVLRIGRRLNTPFYVLGSIGLPVPSFIRDAAYDLVSYMYGRLAIKAGSVPITARCSYQPCLPASFVCDHLPVVCRSQQPGIRCSARQSHAGCVIQVSESGSLSPDTSTEVGMEVSDYHAGMHDDAEGMTQCQQQLSRCFAAGNNTSQLPLSLLGGIGSLLRYSTQSTWCT